ncbi:putative vomeronasal receptor-like protein 4 [Marmota marmota marmota]|uniref:putative vomeronasal receptor-like protein 4 n=1 Tax=Marmota marmota marmota TaxID=9994 RepID=UPI0020928411|nr:putative vomeronasal receptor-like protein 4 [Marmota marmota marmota]
MVCTGSKSGVKSQHFQVMNGRFPMKMDPHLSYVALRKAFYPQAGIGITANTLLLCLHIATVFMGHKPRLTDLPVTYLTLTHILMLLTMGLLVSTDIWETQDIPGDFKCKVLVFLHKVMRGLSICTTCVLSVLQAITISPSGSWLANFKLKSTNPIVGLFVFLWALTMSLSSNLLLCTVATPNKTQPGLLFSPQRSPEERATYTILLLISCFEILYCVDSIFSLFVGMTWTGDPILLCLQMLVANGYGTISPLVLISADTHIIKRLELGCVPSPVFRRLDRGLERLGRLFASAPSGRACSGVILHPPARGPVLRRRGPETRSGRRLGPGGQAPGRGAAEAAAARRP